MTGGMMFDPTSWVLSRWPDASVERLAKDSVKVVCADGEFIMTASTGIPIPTAPNGVYCAGCGETGRHAADCPSLPPKRTANEEIRAADRFVLLDRIDATAAEVAALTARVETLEKQLAVLTNTIERFLTRLAAP